jgi:hypothetical protein
LGRPRDVDPRFNQPLIHGINIVDPDSDLHGVWGSGVSLFNSGAEPVVSSHPQVPRVLGKDPKAEDVYEEAPLSSRLETSMKMWLNRVPILRPQSDDVAS